ncbi:MAG: hypothetical protein HC838_03165, partial [Spirulinaceae cyanobacterium RM2_2_10]|nr:hypothetical protein [Spirulinaceae cyanobacterium RM2_2_10]
ILAKAGEGLAGGNSTAPPDLHASLREVGVGGEVVGEHGAIAGENLPSLWQSFSLAQSTGSIVREIWFLRWLADKIGEFEARNQVSVPAL